MKAVEIVNFIMERRELRRKAQAEAQTTLNAGGKAVPNRPLKKRRKPINGPVLMTFSFPQREILMGDAEAPEK
jgi:hypothetical protein